MGGCLAKTKLRRSGSSIKISREEKMFQTIQEYDLNLEMNPELTFEMRYARENSNDKGEKFNVETANLIV